MNINHVQDFTFAGNVPITTRPNNHDGDAHDATSDAAGFIATVAKNQGVFFSELRIDEECVPEIEGDMLAIPMPRVTVMIALSKCQFADQIAKWAADSWATYAKACFEDLRN